MTRSTPLHPAYIDFIKSRDAGPLLHQVKDLDAFNKALDEHFATLELSNVIQQDQTVEFNGRTLDLRLLRPLGTENEVLPVIIFYHGGGYCGGSKDSYAQISRNLCIKNHAAIVFPNYSLAPKVKFPEIHEECYATLEWVLCHGKDHRMNTSQVATCGDSAGGNLAITIPLMAKQRGLEGAIKAQISIYPVTAFKREHYPSYEAFGKGEYILTQEEMQFISTVYHDGVSSNGGDDKWMYPLLASVDELRDLPPALLITAEADILRDEGEEYAQKLLQAGVKTAGVRVLGTIHGYMSIPDTPQYLQTMAMIKFHLDEAFDRL